MTKEITKAFILQQIQDKFGMREFAPAAFLFDETVVPVYNIEQHLEEMYTRYVIKSITSTGGKTLLAVPGTERWHLKRYDVVFMGVSTFTVAGVYITRINRSPADSYIYLDLEAAQSVSYHKDVDVILNPGDIVGVSIDGYTSTADLRLYVDYLREEIR